MTISPGSSWGEAFPDRVALEQLPVAASDAELAELAGRANGGRFRLTGGDLFRTLGSPDPTRGARGEAMCFPVDLLEVALGDDRVRYAIAHVVARRGRWWAHRTVVVMNASFVGALNLGPKAHPNDGRADATDGRLGRRDRWSARHRMAAGTHLPHPALSVTRRAELSFDFAEPTPIILDGEPNGETRHLSVRVIPDAFEVVA